MFSSFIWPLTAREWRVRIESNERRFKLTLVLRLVSLAAEDIDVLCEDFELLPYGIEGIVETRLRGKLLGRTLGRGACWLEVFVL